MSKETAYLRRLKKQGIKSIFRQKNTPGTHDKILKSVPNILDKNSGKAQKKETRYSDGITQFPHQPKTTNLNEP